MSPRRPFGLGIVLVVLALTACQAGPTDDPAGPAEVAPSTGLHLLQSRAAHRAVSLPDGSVLLLGGCTLPGCGGFEEGRVAEIYRAGAGFVPGPELSVGRAGMTATLLPDGRVLVAGGYPGEGQAPTPVVELLDPSTGASTQVGRLLVARADHSASVLPDGRVLLAGGFDSLGDPLASTEIFDPADLTPLSFGPSLTQARAAHVSVVIDDAVVLVGGTRGRRALRSTEVFRRGSWAVGPELRVARVKLGAVALQGGLALVVGGSRTTEGRRRLASTELLDLARATTAVGPRLTVAAYKLDGAVAMLPDGRVVVATGNGLDVFDPSGTTVTRLDVVLDGSRSFRTVTPLADGSVLVAGGYDETIRPRADAVVVSLPPRTPAQAAAKR